MSIFQNRFRTKGGQKLLAAKKTEDNLSQNSHCSAEYELRHDVTGEDESDNESGSLIALERPPSSNDNDPVDLAWFTGFADQRALNILGQ